MGQVGLPHRFPRSADPAATALIAVIGVSRGESCRIGIPGGMPISSFNPLTFQRKMFQSTADVADQVCTRKAHVNSLASMNSRHPNRPVEAQDPQARLPRALASLADVLRRGQPQLDGKRVPRRHRRH